MTLKRQIVIDICKKTASAVRVYFSFCILAVFAGLWHRQSDRNRSPLGCVPCGTKKHKTHSPLDSSTSMGRQNPHAPLSQSQNLRIPQSRSDKYKCHKCAFQQFGCPGHPPHTNENEESIKSMHSKLRMDFTKSEYEKLEKNSTKTPPFDETDSIPSSKSTLPKLDEYSLFQSNPSNSSRKPQNILLSNSSSNEHESAMDDTSQGLCFFCLNYHLSFCDVLFFASPFLKRTYERGHFAYMKCRVSSTCARFPYHRSFSFPIP